jgi:hypothetical protein
MSCHDRWKCRGVPIACSPCFPDVNPLDFYLWAPIKPLCMQFLLTTIRHFTIGLWMPVRISATTREHLNGSGGPPWGYLKHSVQMYSFNCNLQINRFQTHFYTGISLVLVFGIHAENFSATINYTLHICT